MTLFISLLTFNLKAQVDDESTFTSMLKQVYEAYESGDNDAMWSFYTDHASEISPDGRLTVGKEDLKLGWDQFMEMVDAKPRFSYELTSWRLITPEVALVSWKSVADIKVSGQQIGGPTTCIAVLHKMDGKWKIEFDGMTPILPMPGGN